MKNFQEFQEATRLKKEVGYDKGGTKKPPSTSRDTVLDAVKKSITDKYGIGEEKLIFVLMVRKWS